MSEMYTWHRALRLDANSRGTLEELTVGWLGGPTCHPWWRRSAHHQTTKPGWDDWDGFASTYWLQHRDWAPKPDGTYSLTPVGGMWVNVGIGRNEVGPWDA